MTSQEDLQTLKVSLLSGSLESYEHCLTSSAKWCSEQAHSIEMSLSQLPPPPTLGLSPDTFPRFLFARSLFAMKEYLRASLLLEPCQEPPAIFLKFYCKYLHGEKRKAENDVDRVNLFHRSEGCNQELRQLKTQLEQTADKLDGYGLYLYAVVLRDLSLSEEAIGTLLRAVTASPLNWAAWLLLARTLPSKEALSELTLPEHWMQSFFIPQVHLELQLFEDAASFYKQLLLQGLQKSAFVLSQLAVCYYNLREIADSYDCFVSQRELDPFSLENMDTFSNVLFVNNMKPELGLLAQSLQEIDVHKPTTNFAIANYYSISNQHNMAIAYFQRALKINRSYPAAWILLGHEYIELKQPELANEAYRQAKELNSADWRAWYGLGQTHELLQMYSFALHYYRHASELRPNDSRMVVALGVCYETLDEVDKAKRCFQRAIALGDNEQTALVRLAKLHERMKEEEEAATLYLQLVDKAERIGLFQPSDEFCAHQFLATHFLARKQFDKSELHAKKCCEYPQTSEVGKSILKDIYTTSSSLTIIPLTTSEDSPVPTRGGAPAEFT